MTLSDFLERLRAAERTVDVLKRKVIGLYGEAGSSAILERLAREEHRRREVDERRRLAEARANDLAKYSRELEEEVLRRTEALRAIHDNVGCGFLLVDERGVVLPGFTRSCFGLFCVDQVDGVPLAELLGTLDPRERASFELGIAQVFDDWLPEEVTLAQIPTRCVVGGRILRFEFRCIREGERVASLLVTITDATSHELAMTENATNRALIQALRQKAAFAGFVADAKQLLDQARTDLGDQELVRRAIHTVKGNSAAYGLQGVVDAAHRVEEDEITEAGIGEVEDELRGFLELGRDALGIELDQEEVPSYEVSIEEAERLRELVEDCAANEGAIRSWAARLHLRPAEQLVGPLDQFVERLGAKLGKVVEFELVGADVLLDAEWVGPVLGTLSHCIRNAVDHGIEEHGERSGKPMFGTVALRFFDCGEVLRIEVSDDGRGIDPEILAAKAIERGVWTEAERDAASEEEVLELIFSDGLSTAAEVSDTSGRGVGMGAVRASVVDRGGRVRVESALGSGTTLHLELPKPPSPGNPGDAGDVCGERLAA